jgi:hypothetical protein
MRANEKSGLQGGVTIMAMPYTKDNILCSPTSALENKLNDAEPPGRGTEESALTDTIFIVRDTVTRLCLSHGGSG